jgi:hypothetical protein
MQQETPVSLPPPVPATPPSAPPLPPQKDQQGSFYQAQPAPYTATDHAATAPADAYAEHDDDYPTTLTWEASEYIHTDKGTMWLVSLGVIVAVVAGIAIWLQAWTFLVLVIAMGSAVGVFAFRPPHVLRYTLDDGGIHIGDKTYHYSDFHSFGILQDGAFFTMTFIPVKRFAPALSIYFSEQQGEDIVDIVSDHLPMVHLQFDILDRVMRRLRF